MGQVAVVDKARRPGLRRRSRRQGLWSHCDRPRSEEPRPGKARLRWRDRKAARTWQFV